MGGRFRILARCVGEGCHGVMTPKKTREKNRKENLGMFSRFNNKIVIFWFIFRALRKICRFSVNFHHFFLVGGWGCQ